MKEKIVLNSLLMKLLCELVKDMLENTIEDNPQKVNTIIAVNNFINQLGFDLNDVELSELVGETLINKMFDEIKNNI